MFCEFRTEQGPLELTSGGGGGGNISSETAWLLPPLRSIGQRGGGGDLFRREEEEEEMRNQDLIPPPLLLFSPQTREREKNTRENRDLSSPLYLCCRRAKGEKGCLLLVLGFPKRNQKKKNRLVFRALRFCFWVLR